LVFAVLIFGKDRKLLPCFDAILTGAAIAPATMRGVFIRACARDAFFNGHGP
jgi:hypothetical protein